MIKELNKQIINNDLKIRSKTESSLSITKNSKLKV